MARTQSTEPNRAAWGLLALAALLAAASAGYSKFENAGQNAPAQNASAAPAPDIAELRARADAAPGDARAWSELAMAHFDRGEFAAAAGAYRRAAAADGSKAALWSALGEALVMASDRDPLPAEALTAFERAAALDPSDPRARYFLAAKRDLDKDHEGAIAAWLALLADTPPGAPWEADLVRTIEQVGRINRIDVAARIASVQAKRPEAAGSRDAARAAAPPMERGPSAADVAAAGGMTPAQQREMAQGMVAQLEARLRQNPANLDGWVMLMRSHMALGETAKAKAALEAAVKANPQQAAELRRQAQALGVN